MDILPPPAPDAITAPHKSLHEVGHATSHILIPALVLELLAPRGRSRFAQSWAARNLPMAAVVSFGLSRSTVHRLRAGEKNGRFARGRDRGEATRLHRNLARMPSSPWRYSIRVEPSRVRTWTLAATTAKAILTRGFSVRSADGEVFAWRRIRPSLQRSQGQADERMECMRPSRARTVWLRSPLSTFPTVGCRVSATRSTTHEPRTLVPCERQWTSLLCRRAPCCESTTRTHANRLTM